MAPRFFGRIYHHCSIFPGDTRKCAVVIFIVSSVSQLTSSSIIDQLLQHLLILYCFDVIITTNAHWLAPLVD